MPLFDKYVPTFRHRITRKTEMHSDTSRNWLERPFSSFELWIDLDWSHSWPCRSSLDYIRVNAVRLSTWAICNPFKMAGTRVIGGFRILRRSAKCTRRPNLKAARKKNKSITIGNRGFWKGYDKELHYVSVRVKKSGKAANRVYFALNLPA